MFIFYVLGVISSVFALLSYYPLFQEETPVLWVIFGLLSVFFFYLFCRTVSTGDHREPPFLIMVKTGYLFSLNLVLEAIGLSIYVAIFSRWREFPFLNPIFQTIFSLFKIDNSISSGSLCFYGMADYPYSWLPNAGNLGLSYFLMIISGFFPLLFLSESRKRIRYYLRVTFFSLVIYVFIRVIFLIFLFDLSNTTGVKGAWFGLSLFWHPINGFLSFLPWVIFIYLFFRNSVLDLDSLKSILTKKNFLQHLPSSLFLGCCVCLLFLFFFWVPSGSEKGGRVLFEEYYSDWSKSTRPIDEEWFNPKSTYNYYTFRTFLNHFFTVRVNEGPLENVDLSKYDVIILKIPTRPYSPEVISKLVTYVKEGGGIWVIGDHTNVFGSTTFLNPLLKSFGTQLRYDAVYHNVHLGFNRINSREPVKHPIMQNVPAFLFATPCSIQADNPLMQIVIPGLTTRTYRINYANKNFFPDKEQDLDINFGSNVILTAGDFGKGRVAVFSDSTAFSNFYFYLPGKTELALAVVSWLNHRPAPIIFKTIIGLLLIFSISVFAYYYLRIDRRSGSLFWFSVLTMSIAIIMIFVINPLNRLSYKVPLEKHPFITGGFLDKFTSIYLPFEEFKYNSPDDYNTFYTWGQREGIRNRYFFDLDQAIKDSKALFMILPKNKFTSLELDKLDLYLRDGGKIFLLDSGGIDSSSNNILERYGLHLTFQADGTGKVINHESGFFFDNSLPVGLIEGKAEVLLHWQDKYGQIKPVFVKKEVGKGELYVFGGVLNFSNRNFGLDGIIPEGNKRKINDLILEIYKLILQ